MLRSLHIENLAVIKSADLLFPESERSFAVLTGETGAGKSLIIDSINLLLGFRVSRDLIRRGEKAASVTALFDSLSESVMESLTEMGIETEDGAILLQKTLSADGKSAAHVNGRPITQTMLREIGAQLVNIHGQNDNQKMTDRRYQLEILDAYAGNAVLLATYKPLYQTLIEYEKEKSELSRDEAEKVRLREMLTYQIADIDAAKLKVGLEEALEGEKIKLANAEKIQKYVTFAERMLSGGEKGVGASELLDRAASSLDRLAALLPDAAGLADEARELHDRIDALSSRTSAYGEEGIEDPTSRIDEIEGQLDILSKLKRKYGNTVEEILAFRENAARQLAQIESADDRLLELDKEIAAQKEKVAEVAAALSQKRRDAAVTLCRDLKAELAFLDMPNVAFLVRQERKPLPDATGCDDLEFLLSANAGEEPMPLGKIASGGELARIMLALRCVLSDADGIATLIFDEVDAGISGKTSRKVGIKLKTISRAAQVLCVTHSAQIASIAPHHFLIAKSEKDGRTETAVRLIEGEERVGEIARILGGIEITEAQRAAAEEMIREGETY